MYTYSEASFAHTTSEIPIKDTPGQYRCILIQTTQCHSKQASEFAFAGSSSLLATGGQSSDGKNVCLWDTLLPQRKAMIGSFQCHEHGCSALLYAPHNRLLISAGKKGDIGKRDSPSLTSRVSLSWDGPIRERCASSNNMRVLFFQR